MNFLKWIALKFTNDITGHACYKMGCNYLEGEIVHQNYKEAIKWFEKAIHKGSVKALYNLAKMYKEGEGVEKDDKIAFTYYKKAAYENHTESQIELGKCYEYGNGVEEDKILAYMWYNISNAISGDTSRMYHRRLISHDMTFEEINIAQAKTKRYLNSSEYD